ncbi:MAG: hypothetical protein NC092_14105 [Butyrivibrio sp.]|nr:hypothetical protein [Muribaculum sp.]MCM1553802.1 hypothetical protein [Butyrivibrio sp.]
MYRQILSVNLRHNFVLPFLAALGVMAAALIVFGATGLTEQEAALPLEMLVSWVGAVLLTPVFLPEQNREIRDVVRSKRTDYVVICAIRAGYSVAGVVLCVSLYVGLLKINECQVSGRLLFGAVATALFLGAVGMLAAALSDNAAVGYMAAMMYYLVNYGLREKLGVFYLFGMRGGEYAGKGWLVVGAVCLMGVALRNGCKK